MGTTSSFFGGGGGGGGCLPWYGFSPAQCASCWVPPCDGRVVIHVIGSGACGSNSYNGGGAGGYTRKEIDVTASDCYYMIIAGDAACFSTFCNVSGSAINLCASGGQCCTTTCVNGAGGCGYGGDVNRQGGQGGKGEGNTPAGGGAVNIFGATSTAGGNSNCTSEYNGSGGGGVGTPGSRGCVVSSSQFAPGGGGGSLLNYGEPHLIARPGKGGFVGGQAAGPGQADVCGCMFFRFINNWGIGGSTMYTQGDTYCQTYHIEPGIGGGGAGGGYSQPAQNGGMFAGGGGSTGGFGGNGGNGGWPGGGGGARKDNLAGQGGRGGIFIEYLTL